MRNQVIQNQLRRNQLKRSVLFLFLAMSTPTVCVAQDTVYMEETVITGNQELPKVLYILPWREMQTEALPRRTLNFENQSLLAPIYPDEQKRQLVYRSALNSAREKLNPSGSFSNEDDASSSSKKSGFTKRFFKKIF